jgi:peptidylprolyl isomerase
MLTRLFSAAAIVIAAAAALFAQPQRVTAIPPPPDVAAAPADAQKSPSGLAWKVLSPGKGTTHPKPEDRVTVDYTGWTTDGRMFDSSIARGVPLTVQLNRVIKGWIEGVPLMVEGETRRLWIPDTLAYKEMPTRPQGTLVFDVALLAIEDVSTPADVAAPPADAEKTGSGLASKVLKPGTGDVHPTAKSTVLVHYTGWNTKGQMFDSSVMRGEPMVTALDKVIKGWTEGVQLMVVGEKRRLWIPEKLAYQGQEGPPKGMLVFDVQLLGIK